MDFRKPNDEQKALLRRCASMDQSVADVARRELSVALEVPLRSAVLVGPIFEDIFERTDFDPNQQTKYPIDTLTPGSEAEHVAYTMPGQGYIPLRHVEGDYVQVPTYVIANAIDWDVRMARDARWDWVGRQLRVFKAGFTKKLNNDGWHVILAAGVDRNIIPWDGDANAGQFTKGLVSLMQVVMKRNGGGNSASVGRSKLTDLFVSPESIVDMRNWNLSIVDDITRREIYTASDDALNNVFGVNIRELVELGEGQEYQNYFSNELAGSYASGDVELVVGLDLLNKDSFVMPVRQDLEMADDPTLRRSLMQGVFGTMEVGFACLDNRRVLLGSY